MSKFFLKKSGRLPLLPGERPRSTPPNDDELELFEDENPAEQTPALKKKVIHEKPPKPAAIPDFDAAPETSRLSLIIDRTLHRRLKLEAVKQDQTIISMIESWIEENCPEV